jgi:uncharacterized Zn finger protein
MVQFTPKLEVSRRPSTPPVCPKCGSHRTEVIGNSDDPTKKTLRCNACGAISTVVNDAAVFIGEEVTVGIGAA